MKGYYDFEGIKTNVPIRDVVAYYTGQQTSGNTPIHCPDPNHNDSNPSATFYDKKNNCRCWSCGGVFNVLEVVKLNRGCQTFYEAAELLCRDFGLTDYVTYKEEPAKKRSAVTQVLLRKIGLDGNGITMTEETDEMSHVFTGTECTKYDMFTILDKNPVMGYEMVLSHLKARIHKLTESLALVESERETMIGTYGIPYIQRMLTDTEQYITFRQKEISDAKAEFDAQVAAEKEQYLAAGNPESSFKPSIHFKRPKTAYVFDGDARRLVERGLAYLNDTDFIRDNKKELEAMNKSLEKILAEYHDIVPKSKSASVEQHSFDLKAIYRKRQEMNHKEEVLLAAEVTTPLPQKKPVFPRFSFGTSDMTKESKTESEPSETKKPIPFNFGR